MSNTAKLESALHAIISEAVARAVTAVRLDLAEMLSAPVSAPKLTGRPPGSGKAGAPAPAPPATKAVAKPTRKAAKGRPGARTYSDADLARVLEVVKAKPGALPSQYQAASGLKENVFKAAVFRLKQEGRLTVVGKARNTSYTVAGATSPSPAATAPAVAAKKGKAIGKKGGRGGQTFTEADLARVLGVIKARAGLRPSQYQKESRLSQSVWKNAIYRLKQDGKIKVHGAGRGTSYSVA